MNNAQYVNQTSGKVEYYTPLKIIEAARRVMGSIDLDPASSAVANRIVGATRFFSEEENGLLQPWSGNVWMNHPFGKQVNRQWIEKLVYEFQEGNIAQACCITYACTSELWFQPLFDYPLCFLSPRTNYRLADGTIKKGVTKGSVVTYLGPHEDCSRSGFVHEFNCLGTVMVSATTGGLS